MEKYKPLKCDVCNKTYLDNYFYAHKKTKKHIKNINAIEIKKDLLKEDEKKETSTDELFDDLINQLQLLKIKLIDKNKVIN